MVNKLSKVTVDWENCREMGIVVGLGLGRKRLLGLDTLGWPGISKKVPQHQDGHATKGGRKRQWLQLVQEHPGLQSKGSKGTEGKGTWKDT